MSRKYADMSLKRLVKLKRDRIAEYQPREGMILLLSQIPILDNKCLPREIIETILDTLDSIKKAELEDEYKKYYNVNCPYIDLDPSLQDKLFHEVGGKSLKNINKQSHLLTPRLKHDDKYKYANLVYITALDIREAKINISTSFNVNKKFYFKACGSNCQYSNYSCSLIHIPENLLETHKDVKLGCQDCCPSVSKNSQDLNVRYVVCREKHCEREFEVPDDEWTSFKHFNEYYCCSSDNCPRHWANLINKTFYY